MLGYQRIIKSDFALSKKCDNIIKFRNFLKKNLLKKNELK